MRGLHRQEGRAGLEFFRDGLTPVDRPPSMAHLLLDARVTAFFDEPLAEILGMLAHAEVVHEEEALRADGRDGADLAVRGGHVRGVEGREDFEGTRTPDLHVDAAAEFLAVERDVFAGLTARRVHRVDTEDDLAFFGQHHRHRLAARFGVELARDDEQRIAQDFGLEAALVLTAEEAVVGIDEVALGVAIRFLTPGVAREDEPMELLQAPALRHEF